MKKMLVAAFAALALLAGGCGEQRYNPDESNAPALTPAREYAHQRALSAAQGDVSAYNAEVYRYNCTYWPSVMAPGECLGR